MKAETDEKTHSQLYSKKQGKKSLKKHDESRKLKIVKRFQQICEYIFILCVFLFQLHRLKEIN